MSDPSLRRAAIADLRRDDSLLGRLVENGEDLLVERKAQPNSDWRNVAEAIASFANSLGGWLLLGVDDVHRSVTGWSPPGRADAQAHLGEILRTRLDPLPAFTAALVELQGKSVGVIRVYPADDSPVLVSATGAVYVRTAKGKETARRSSDFDGALTARGGRSCCCGCPPAPMAANG